MDFFSVAVESVDDPCLFGLVLFMKTKDVSGGFYIMDYQWFLILFGEKNVLLKDFQLKAIGVFVESVEASFADGDDIVFFKKVY